MHNLLTAFLRSFLKMRLLFGAVLLPALTLFADAFPNTASHAVHEKRELTHPKWIKRGEVHPLAILPMKIGMTQSNLDRGFEYVMDVYVHQDTLFVPC